MSRILSALVLILTVLGVLVWAPLWATIALALVALFGAVWELAGLAEHVPGAAAGAAPPAASPPPRRLPRVLMFVGAAVALLSVGAGAMPVEIPLLAAFLVVGCVLVAEARTDLDAVRRVSVALFPILYLGLPLGALVAIRRDHGAFVVLVLLATTVVSDSAQYYGGRLLGRRPLAPRISPKKTVEGAVTGVVFGSLVLPLAGASLFPATPAWALALTGASLVLAGIVGDLFESLLKRSAGVKDASHLIPGHGGVLDRIDSLLFAAPVYYGFLRF